MDTIIRKNASGGKGEIHILPLLSEEERKNVIHMYGKITVLEGSSIGIHKHIGNSESYYILSGKGRYTDEKGTSDIQAGDVLYCNDGSFHGVENTGAGNLVFMALIIKSPETEKS